jgi:hypothetical protein
MPSNLVLRSIERLNSSTMFEVDSGIVLGYVVRHVKFSCGVQ